MADHEPTDDVADTTSGAAVDDRGPVPRPRPGFQTPRRPGLSERMNELAPVMAAMIRAIIGVVGFVGSLLAMPVHMATPFLVGVSLLMMVGGCTSTINVTRDDVRLRRVGRFFTIGSVAIVMAAIVAAGVLGPGAFAPRIDFSMRRAPPVDDGTIRFEPVP